MARSTQSIPCSSKPFSSSQLLLHYSCFAFLEIYCCVRKLSRPLSLFFSPLPSFRRFQGTMQVAAVAFIMVRTSTSTRLNTQADRRQQRSISQLLLSSDTLWGFRYT